MSEKLELMLLGSPAVYLDGNPVTGFRSSKALALLCYLAVTQRAHTRTALTGLLWGDLPDSQARRSLTTTLSNLRHLVGNHLIIGRHEIALDPHTSCWLDVAVLEAAVERFQAGPDIQQLEAAIELYRGDFLEEFYVRMAPEFEQWVSAERERLRALVTQALHELGIAYERETKWTHAIDCIRRLLALEPWREEAHRHLMRLLAQSGQRGAALTHYRICCQCLADELDVEPDAETMRLYEQIRDGEAPFRPGEQRQEQPFIINLPRHNLPAQTAPLVGRKGELAELARLLADPAVRLVTILAPGGMGKTRLALEAAATQIDCYRQGVYFVALAPLTTVDSVIPAIANAVHLTFQADPRPPKQQLFDYLREKQLLLLLDNSEHLPEAAGLADEILQAAPFVRILVTARERLKLSAETIFRLHGLDVPGQDTHNPADFSAVQLFLQQARRLRPQFTPAATDWPALAQTCRLVQGLPLGILLAAAWIETLTPQEIAAELSRGIEFLETDLRDLPVRQRSMAAVLTQTWERLNKAERLVFMQLSVFRGGFTRQAVQAVSGATLGTLAGLVDKALLWRSATGRCEVHELLRQYAEEQLMAAGLVDATRDAHCAYFVDFLSEREADLKGGRQVAALNELESDKENLLVAWRWSVQQGQVQRLARAMESLCLFHEMRGYFYEGEAACQQAVQRLTDANDNLRTLARALSWQGSFGKKLGHARLAEQQYRQSLALLDKLATAGQDIRAERAFALSKLGGLLWYADVEAARQVLEESLTLCQAIGDQWRTAQVQRELARVAWAAGAPLEMKQRAQESRTIRRTLNDLKGLSATLSVLCWAAQLLGQYEQAHEHAQEQYAIGQALDDQLVISQSFFNLGIVALYQGQFAEAQATFEQGQAIAKELGDRHHLNTLRIWLARTKLHLGEYQEAHLLAQESLAMADEIGLRSHRGDATALLGQAAIVESTYALAEQWLEESKGIFQAIRQPVKLTRVLASLGCAACATSQHSRARRYLSELLRVVAEREDFDALLEALPLAALLLANQGQHEWAVEVYTAALRYPFIANSCWFADVAGRVIQAAQSHLPPAVAHKAREKGQAWEIRELVVELQSSAWLQTASDVE
ncbi:MAG: hypothetical protein DCC55_03015 [Chloroflexi bacterium]|nr:MAG: hypothetical protein DCC55_03015 [Chloroflexota bacterium]